VAIDAYGRSGREERNVHRLHPTVWRLSGCDHFILVGNGNPPYWQNAPKAKDYHRSAGPGAAKAEVDPKIRTGL